MEIENLAAIGLEGCGSLLLIVIAYKIYRAKIDTSAESHCCKWLDFKINTHNEGHTNAEPSLINQV